MVKGLIVRKEVKRLFTFLWKKGKNCHPLNLFWKKFFQNRFKGWQLLLQELDGKKYNRKTPQIINL